MRQFSGSALQRQIFKKWRLLLSSNKALIQVLDANTKLKCNNIKTLYNRLVDLLVAFSKIESIIDTSTILSTQRRINRIATSHSKMGILLESMKVALSSHKAVTYILVFEA